MATPGEAEAGGQLECRSLRPAWGNRDLMKETGKKGMMVGREEGREGGRKGKREGEREKKKEREGRKGRKEGKEGKKGKKEGKGRGGRREGREKTDQHCERLDWDSCDHRGALKQPEVLKVVMELLCVPVVMETELYLPIDFIV
jgi:hypothetical protein